MLMEQGNHDGVLVKIECGEAQTGTPFIALVCYLPSEDTHRTVYNYVTPKTEDRVIEDFERLGLDLAVAMMRCERAAGDRGDGLPIYELPEGEQVDVTLNCLHDEYKGEVREKWQLRMGGGPSSATAVKMDRLQSLRDKWQAKHGTTPKKTNRAAAREAMDRPVTDDEVPGGVTDEECPF